MKPSAPSPATLAQTLPADWNAEHDLLVWVGPGARERLPACARGSRTFVVATDVAAAGVQQLASPAELYSAVMGMGGAMPTRAWVHGGTDVPRADLSEAGHQLSQALQARHVMLNTLESGGLRWVRQGLGNLAVVAERPSLAGLKDAFRGIPAVLVAPGPSLTRNVAQLADLSRRALIVSGTHALHALQHAGVAPHLVVGTDPGDLARHWSGVDLSDIEAFALAGTCAPESLAVPARRLFTFPGNGPADAWLYGPLQEPVTLASGGSVSCVQLSLAHFLGCDPIVFVGLDLSFGEQYYATGGLDADARVELDERGDFMLVKAAGAEGPGRPLENGRLRFTRPKAVLELPGWEGGTVRTSPQLKVYHGWFEANAPTLCRGRRLINATEGGARIAGFEQRRLAEVVTDWGPAPAVGAVLDRATGTHDAAARRRALLAASRAQLRALEACRQEVERCRTLARQARVREDRLGALGRAEKKLVQSLKQAPIVSLVSQAEILAAREAARQARTLEANLQASERLYAVVRRGIAELLEPLREACRALE